MRNGPLLGGVAIVIIAVALGLYFTYNAPGDSSGAATSTPSVTLTFYCGGGYTFDATFATSSVALAFSDGQSYTLPQVRSGSGTRYEATSTGSDLLLIGKGDYGSFTNSASTTDVRYSSCTAANVADSDAPGYETYSNLGDTFSFTFPTNFSVAGIEVGYGPDWSAPATTTGLQLAKITVPQSYEPGTNFGDAWLTVGTSADPQAVASCTQNLQGMKATSTPVTIGSQTYTKLLFTGVGAGNIYDTTSYRTVKDNQCYAIEYTVHYSNIQNYPAGQVTEFDEQKVTAALDEVARSFRFK